MGVRRIALPWDTQPQRAAAPAPEWAGSLLSVFNGGVGFYDVALNKPFVQSATAPNRVPGLGGYGINGNGVDHFAYIDTPALSLDGATILAVVHGGSNKADARAVSMATTANNDNYFAIGTGAGANGAKMRVVNVVSANAGTSTINTAADVFNGGPRAVALRWQRGIGTTAFVAGAMDAFATNAQNSPLTVNRVSLLTLARTTFAGGHVGTVYLAAFFNRALSDDECRALTADPYDTLFERRAIWVPVNAAAPSSGVLSLALGNATLAATGKLAVAGLAGSMLADATLAATGQVGAQGALGAQLADASAVSVAQLPLAGAVVAPLADATSASEGVLQAQAGGSLSVTLDEATATSGTTVSAQATATVSLSPADVVSTGELRAPGSGGFVVALDSATLLAEGVLQPRDAADVTVALDPSVIAAEAGTTLRGALTAQLAPAEVTSGSLAVVGAPADVALDTATVSSTGVLQLRTDGVLIRTLNDATLAARGGVPSTGGASWDYVMLNGKSAEQNLVENNTMLTSLLNFLTPAAVADAVWAQPLTGPRIPGSAGSMQQDMSARVAATL